MPNNEMRGDFLAEAEKMMQDIGKSTPIDPETVGKAREISRIYEHAKPDLLRSVFALVINTPGRDVDALERAHWQGMIDGIMGILTKIYQADTITKGEK